MLRTIVIILSVMAVTPCFAGNLSLPERGIFVPGRFASFAVAADGAIYLLARDQKVIEVSVTGEQKTIALPTINSEIAEFSDLAAVGGKLYFCGYKYRDIFVLDLADPVVYTSIKTGAPAENLLNIAVKGDGFCVRDADFNLYQVVVGQPAKKLSRDASLESDNNGKTVVIPPPTQSGLEIVPPGRVFFEDRTPLWEAPVPKAPAQIISLEFLGVDALDRYVFMVISASGELDARHALYAVKDGKEAASLAIPGPDALEMQRYLCLVSGGTILMLQADAQGKEGVWIKELKLEDGKFVAPQDSQG